MEFTYTRRESDIGLVYIPTLPISLNGFPIGQAMIDTGADVTILPMELYQVLGVDLDPRKAIEMCSAGGGRFKAVPSSEKITYSIDHSGFRPIIWKGTVFFASEQPIVLLGHYQCLAELKIILDGKRKMISVEG